MSHEHDIMTYWLIKIGEMGNFGSTYFKITHFTYFFYIKYVLKHQRLIFINFWVNVIFLFTFAIVLAMELKSEIIIKKTIKSNLA